MLMINLLSDERRLEVSKLQLVKLIGLVVKEGLKALNLKAF